MSTTDENLQIKDLMSQVFPGYKEFKVDSVTPSITGEEPLVSFMVVCNDEASQDFLQTDEISVEVIPSVDDQNKDLHLRLDFTFQLFSLQFFTKVDADNPRRGEFARVLTQVEFFVIWLVDKDKELLKILKIDWDHDLNKEILLKVID